MNESPYRVGAEHSEAVAPQTGAGRKGAAVFWIGVLLILISLAGVSYSVYCLTSFLQTSPMPVPQKIPVVVTVGINLTLWRAVAMFSVGLSFCGLACVVFGFRKISNTATS